MYKTALAERHVPLDAKSLLYYRVVVGRRCHELTERTQETSSEASSGSSSPVRSIRPHRFSVGLR